MLLSKNLYKVTRLVLVSVYAKVNAIASITTPHKVSALAAIEWNANFHGLTSHSGAADIMAL
jgi:hypothetical protein